MMMQCLLIETSVNTYIIINYFSGSQKKRTSQPSNKDSLNFSNEHELKFMEIFTLIFELSDTFAKYLMNLYHLKEMIDDRENSVAMTDLV